MSREIEARNHLNDSLPADIPDDLKEFLSQVDGVSFEEAILQQASVYQSIQESGRNRVVGTDDEHTNDSSCSSEEEEDENEDEEEEDEDDGESSRHEVVNSQEARDEAYARDLQEFEEYDEYFIREFNGRASGPTESPISTPSTQISSPDSSQEDPDQNPDPDNMRYEDLLNLTETVGVENVGLSQAQISRLPISIYTSGMFSNNDEENCAVCQENFTLWKPVITLPCSHHYHRKCIIKWLKLKKNCPICQKDVV